MLLGAGGCFAAAPRRPIEALATTCDVSPRCPSTRASSTTATWSPQAASPPGIDGALWLVERVIVGCCNLIAEDGRYVLVKEAKASARGRYNLPAGKPEVGETFTDAAVREAREETGLTVAITRLVGVYHCPKTSEGFAVVNFVFAADRVGGQLAPSSGHPEIGYFSRAQIATLASHGMIRGKHIEAAIDDFEAGRSVPLSIVQVVPASPLQPVAPAKPQPRAR